MDVCECCGRSLAGGVLTLPWEDGTTSTLMLLVHTVARKTPSMDMAKMMIKEVARMTIGILKKGDRVINVTAEFIAIQRKNGEVDIVPLTKDESGLRVDSEGIITIGFGDNIVQTKTIDDVVVTTF
ncbi:hypothetical protein [Roseburia hominis]